VLRKLFFGKLLNVPGTSFRDMEDFATRRNDTVAFSVTKTPTFCHYITFKVKNAKAFQTLYKYCNTLKAMKTTLRINVMLVWF